MQRFAAVWHASPRKLMGVLLLLMLTAGMAVGSGASFTAQTASPGNMVTAGALTIDNNKKNNGTESAIFNAGNMKPGDSVTGTVNVTNTGTVAGDFFIAMPAFTDTAGTSTGKLSDKLTLKVEDTTPVVPTVVYNGLIKNFGTAARALTTSWAASATRSYKFTVTWPAAADDDTYQAAKVSMNFDWSAVQS
jgi:hypothetical protein